MFAERYVWLIIGQRSDEVNQSEDSIFRSGQLTQSLLVNRGSLITIDGSKSLLHMVLFVDAYVITRLGGFYFK